MKNTFFALMALVVASLFTACGGSGANTASNKPANAATNANAAVAPAVDTKAAEAEIRKLMDTAQAALPTKEAADTMEKIYADNYTITNIDGTKQNKEERLKSLRSGEVKYTAFAYKDVNIVVAPDGNSAAVTGKLSMKGTMKGKSLDGDYNITQTFSKAKDGWKLASAAATKIDDKAKMAANANAAPKIGLNKPGTAGKVDPAAAADDGGEPPKKK